MAFFKKLKDRLFKSSSKIDEGLEAIVEDGGEVSAPEQIVDEAPIGPSEAELAAERAEADRRAEQERQRLAAEEAKRQEAARAAAAEAEAARVAAERARLEAARLEQERAEQERLAEEQRAVRAAEIARLEKEATEQARARQAQLDAEARAAEQLEKDRAAREAAEQARIEQERIAAQQAEEARQAEEAARAAQRAIDEAEKQRKQREAREAAEAAQQAAEQALAKPGLLGRLFGRKEQKTVLRRELDDDMLEQLEELLITADMGVDTALRVTANMAEGRFGKKLSVQEIKQLLAHEIAQIMENVAKPLPLYPKTPQVVLVVGVNGSGKTTTIGKLASQFRAAGKKVVIAAGDTFRAAAVEQLQVWGERAGVPVLTAPEGSDPASLAFDALEQAQRDGADLLMIDTAGRLQNRQDLMEELAKIVRVIRKKDETAPHNTLLVLDATTGQNALNQVKIFQEVADVSGLVMTKLDGTAKGGVLVALADKFGLPIHAIGVGEQIDDLAAFDPEEYAAALTGLDPE